MTARICHRQRAQRPPQARKPGAAEAAARKLFVERGYDATRPQDIAREAGLGHGTFYLHYPDKRACFLAFVEDARQELDAHLRSAPRPEARAWKQSIAATLTAIYDYSDSHPGVLRAAMTDEMMIDAEGAQARPLLVRWGEEWAELVRGAAEDGRPARPTTPKSSARPLSARCTRPAAKPHRSGRCRKALVDNLTRFLTRALKPD